MNFLCTLLSLDYGTAPLWQFTKVLHFHFPSSPLTSYSSLGFLNLPVTQENCFCLPGLAVCLLVSTGPAATIIFLVDPTLYPLWWDDENCNSVVKLLQSLHFGCLFKIIKNGILIATTFFFFNLILIYLFIYFRRHEFQWNKSAFGVDFHYEVKSQS